MSEILGVGIDCEDISRFRKLNKLFFSKNFTEKEREYCSGKSDPFPHYAARFACKEAVIKAFGSAGERVSFSEIEILNNKDGVPQASVPRLPGYSIKVSMSHSRGSALGMVIISK